MANIFFLVHRIPYPPDKGDKIRSWRILKMLAEHHQVHLGYFIDDPEDHAHIAFLEECVASQKTIEITPKWRTLGSAHGFLTGEALSVAYYRSCGMQKWVDRLISQEKVDLAVLFSSSMARFLLPHAAKVPVIMDFVDMDSDKWAQYAQSKSWPMSAVYRREAKKLQSYEAKVAAAARASIFVTAEEAALFNSRVPADASKVHSINNGVDTGFFDPGRPYENPYRAGQPVAVFTGAMDYWANVDAALWFAQEVWGQVRRQRPDAVFYIVGGKPSSEVKALDGKDGIRVTGRVADVRPYIAHSSVVVAPLRIARGIQNKVLEGMAMAKPVITTPQGFEGIAATPGKDLMVEDAADDFADRVLAVMDGKVPDYMGSAARQTVTEGYSWEANLNLLQLMIRKTLGAGDQPK